MNSKKAITLLVLATLVFSMVPSVQFASAELLAGDIDYVNDDTGSTTSGEKGHTIKVEGEADSVSSGYEVNIYWDKIQSWNGEKGLLNTTEVDDDGGFKIWFDVPESTEGEHNLWFTATDQSTTARIDFTVLSDCDVSRSSGLAGDKVYVDLWGYDDNQDISIMFVADDGGGDPIAVADWGQAVGADANIETYDVDEDEYDGTLSNGMIEPGTVVFTADNGQIYADDDSDGKLYNDAGPVEQVGTINYVTGEWTLDFATTTGANKPADNDEIDAAYDYMEDDAVGDDMFVLASSGESNDLGSWENKRVTIPAEAAVGQYHLVGMDGKGNWASDDFKIGAVIYLSVEEGPVGTKVEIDGEGFAVDTEVTCTIERNAEVVDVHIIDSEGVDAGDDKTSGTGVFNFECIIPQTSKADDDWEIVVDDGIGTAAADFEITDLAEISVDPDFGPQGSTVTVSGINFPAVKGTDVALTLTTAGGVHVANIDDVETDSDGSFEIDVTVPTENDDTYKIKATVEDDADGAFNIDDSEEFRIGTILILMSKDEAVVGDKIVLTGNGFTDGGEWNATFGDIEIFTEEDVSGTGLLKMNGGADTPEFFVPQLEPGDYVITVWDADAEIMIETDFTISEYTTLDFSTYEAPNEFNVSIDGWYWPEVDGVLNTIDDITFVLWNETDEWDMDVRQLGDPGVAATLNATGYFVDAWWMVPDSDTLSKGTYHVNATIETDNDQAYEMFLDFVIGDVYASITPRKSTFRLADTVNFNVEHSFGGQAAQEVDTSSINVYDPSGNLYWEIDNYEAADWNKVGEYYTLTFASQTDGGNPCVLLDDAPLGEWTYEWIDEDDDEVDSGVFTVEAAASDVISEQVTDLNNQITDLADQLGDVTSEFANVKSDIADVAAIAQQAVTAAQAAAEAVQTVAQTANTAGQAAEAAAAAANAAKDAANGLTTLVYGAIGAALVAALAAIVSLMQISRRIAG
jgi:hypothetical protein